MEPAESHWVELARPFVQHRPVIIAGGPLAGARRDVLLARSLGASRCLVIAGGLGTGELPTSDECDHVFVDVAAPDVTAETRRWEQVLAQPPEELVARLDRFDPRGDAVVWLPPFQTSVSVGGRPVQGARRPEWVALEDKATVDARWDRWGVPRPPAQVVALDDPGGLRDAHADLDEGAGTVWSGDARDGFHGGARFVLRVLDATTASAARRTFSEHCDAVRVAPFVEGVPCSIHGFVFEDHVATFRPVELIVLRSATRGFVYAGTATYWDPPDRDREEMRRLARVVGEALRREEEFRGAFTIDGIMSSDGFVATELNPRFGAGLGPVSGGRADLLLVHRLVTSGHASDYRPVELERVTLQRADAERRGACYLDATGDVEATVTHEVEGARVEVGPRATGPGAFVRVTVDSSGPSRTPFAARAVEVLAVADARLGLGLGPLEAAPVVR
jgi:hypothetical protein